MERIRQHPKSIFLIIVLMVGVAARFIVRSPGFAAHPGSLSWALLADFSVTVPVVYLVVVVRSGAAGLLSVVPVVLLGVLRARAVLPPGRFPLMEGHTAAAVFAGLEVAALGYAFSRVARLRRTLRRTGGPAPDFATAFPLAMAETFRTSMPVSVVAAEVLTLDRDFTLYRRGKAALRLTAPFLSEAH